MDLLLTAEQERWRDEVRALLSPAADPARIMETAAAEPGYDADLWRRLLALGWLSPSVTNLAVVLEEAGRAAVPLPVHNGLVQAVAVLELADDAHRAEHGAALRAGDRRYALCLTELDGSFGPDAIGSTAVPSDDGWLLDGVKAFVSYAASADVLLVVARVNGRPDLGLYAVDPASAGVAVEPISTIGLDRQCVVTFARTPGTPLGPTVTWEELDAALDLARVAVAADMVGAAAAALGAAVARATTRVQWGAPIGSFQAVQHRCADMLIDVTTARDAVYDAAGILDRGEDALVAVAMAKAWCREACQRVTASAHQIHGGEGIYADQTVHLWYRRVAALAPMLGDARFCRERIADQILGPVEGARN
jgi:alkylation response protein AidB-like acyl-CoA dehydrogenase